MNQYDILVDLFLNKMVHQRIHTLKLTCSIVEANSSTSIHEVNSTARGSTAAWAILPVCKCYCLLSLPRSLSLLLCLSTSRSFSLTPAVVYESCTKGWPLNLMINVWMDNTSMVFLAIVVID